jgi:hypothetical protein
MDKWDELREHFVKQAEELEEDDDCAIFALEVLDLMDIIEAKHREEENYEQ